MNIIRRTLSALAAMVLPQKAKPDAPLIPPPAPMFLPRNKTRRISARASLHRTRVAERARLASARGSQAMFALRVEHGFGTHAVGDPEELRVKRNQRRNARKRFERAS